MGLGSALLAAVQPGGGQPPLHLLPPPAHYARSLALSMGRRGAMMAVYSFRRSTRSSRPSSSGEPTTPLCASLHSSASRVSSSSTGSRIRRSVSSLLARARQSSSGYSSRRRSRPLSPTPLSAQRWATLSRHKTTRPAPYGISRWAGLALFGRFTQGTPSHSPCGRPSSPHASARTSLALLLRPSPHVPANILRWTHLYLHLSLWFTTST